MADEITQAEKLEHLHNDLLKKTYFELAQVPPLDVGGRFAFEAPEVTGVPQVPRLTSGPWAGDAVPKTQPPLGYAIDDMNPKGAPAQVASLPVAGPSAAAVKLPLDGVAPAASGFRRRF